ncbi:MAG: DUF3127 domain-containing protein [Aquirufa sp.]
MALELSGKLIKKLPEVTGTGKTGTNWIKQDFVIETQDQYPKKVCMNVWGDKTQDLAAVSEGELIKVQFNVESREYNERWYTDIRAYRIDKVGAAQSGGQVPDNVIVNPSGTVTFPPMEAEAGDDLPF